LTRPITKYTTARTTHTTVRTQGPHSAPKTRRPRHEPTSRTERTQHTPKASTRPPQEKDITTRPTNTFIPGSGGIPQQPNPFDEDETLRTNEDDKSRTGEDTKNPGNGNNNGATIGRMGNDTNTPATTMIFEDADGHEQPGAVDDRSNVHTTFPPSPNSTGPPVSTLPNDNTAVMRHVIDIPTAPHPSTLDRPNNSSGPTTTPPPTRRTSTVDEDKSTTCASTTSPSTTYATRRPHCQDNIGPIDDTMADAVGTLTIGHTKHQTTIPTAPHPWTLVTNPHKKASPTASYDGQEFGLAFERTTKGNNWSTDDLLLILQTIQAHDPKAMLSSADNKTKPTLATAILHKAQKDIPWFTKFTAMKTMTWGKPSDGTSKIVFSFWLTSTIIKKDLAQLRMDSDFTEMLKGTNTYMKVSKLLEPHSKIVGYFLGKDIIHTNRDDITNRLVAHVIKHSQTQWTPAFDVVNTTVLGKGHNTRMVTLVVGNTDYQGVLDILTQQPMETLSFLDHRTKRQDINQFDKMLKYHDYIVSHSTAVRLENVTSLDTQELWAHLQPITNTTYCDISDGRNQGTTYIQCFKEKEPEVATAIQSYLLTNLSESENRPIIGERGSGTVNSSSTGTRTYRGNHSGKSTGKETTATLNHTSQKAFAAFLKNCPTIDIPSTLPTKPHRGNNRPPVTGWSPTARSYKDILAGTPSGDNSPNSSITMQSQKTEPTGNKSSNRSRKSLESENVELRSQLNHMQQAQTAMQDTQNTLLDTQNKLLAQIATMSAAIQDLMKQQGLATGTSTTITSPPRKLSKHNRTKTPRTTKPNNTPPATAMATPEVSPGDNDSPMADTGSESGVTPLPPTANPPTVSHPGGCRAE